MRKPMPYVSLHDIPLDLVDGDCDGSCCPDGGLCWPDDPLDKVINYVSVLDDGFLEALGIDCSQSPPREVPPALVTAPGGRDGDDEYSKSAEDMDMDVDVGALGGGEGKLNACDMSGGVAEFALAAESALVAGSGGKLNACDMSCCVPESAPAIPDGCSDACGALAGFVSNGAPPLPASYALSCSASTTSTTSWSCSLSSTSWETESPPLASPFQAWAVPRKRRRRPTTVCKRPWSLVFPLVLVPAAAHDSHVDNNGNGGNDGEFNCGNGVGGGIVRRRLVARQRNRQAQRTCCHCHTSETPQWRAGPDGPGTLCNACGIRYKMNKLLPEYRPSTSPSFRSGEHSNRHRKVVKLREQKEKALTLMASALPPAPNAGEVLRLCTYTTAS